MKKILITGCYGQLGRALNGELEGNVDVEILNTDVDTLDICDYSQVEALVMDNKPDFIINCAAHTAVDKCESDQDNAFRINAIGPENLAKAADKAGAAMIQVSTDYVFDGSGSRPYVETDATNPQSVYGSTKLAGEQKVMAATDRYYIFRTAWLYGDGNNFVKTMLRLAEERDSLTVVSDQFGTPTSAMELARMILHVIETGKYGIYHATCEGNTDWYHFALKIFENAGKNINVKPVTTAEYPTAAKRPAYSVLENAALNALGDYRMKEWEAALEEYMSKSGFMK